MVLPHILLSKTRSDDLPRFTSFDLILLNSVSFCSNVRGSHLRLRMILEGDIISNISHGLNAAHQNNLGLYPPF